VATEALANQTNGTSAVFNEMLPVDPFRSLYVHFGMLLGVDDFQTLDAYHRGKMWYHSAWLHGQGVIWGLEVVLPELPIADDDFEAEPTIDGEVKVQPGLALDGLGRELYLEHSACLNIAAWYQAHQDDDDLQSIVEVDEETGDISFDAHVSLEFRGCLSRQVPALSEPCDGTSTTTAYSRVVETVKVCMNPGAASEHGKDSYHRLRLLFGIDQPEVDEEGVTTESDQDVLDARIEIESASEEQKAALCQQWFKHFAILDEMDITPESEAGTTQFSSFPRTTPGTIVLANINGLRLHLEDEVWSVIQGSVDNMVRPFLLPTCTIQDLLCSGLAVGESSPEPIESEETAAVQDAGGPRIDEQSIELEGTEMLHFNVLGGPLMKASADAQGLCISAFDTRDGWIPVTIKTVSYDPDSNRVSVELRDAPGGNLIRLIVKGTGESPFMGRNRIPLAGGSESGPGSIHNGTDFVFMFRARSGS
jgi:hypothetical protein